MKNMEEKPFEASKQKLQKARLKGDVPRSKLLASSLIFLGTLFLLRFFSPYFFNAIVDLMHYKISLKPIMTTLVLFWIGVIVLTVLVHLLQSGLVVSWEALKPSAPKSVHLEWSLILIALDIAVICGLVLLLIKPSESWVVADEMAQFRLVCHKCYAVALIIALSLVILGLLDWYICKKLFMKKMGMSAAEKAEEDRDNQLK